MQIDVNDGDYIVQRDAVACVGATRAAGRGGRPTFVVVCHGSSHPTARFTSRTRAEDFARERAARDGLVALFRNAEGHVEVL
jgi:hypothetical protein